MMLSWMQVRQSFSRPPTRRINNVERCEKVCRSSRIDEVDYAYSDTATVTSDERQEDSVEAVPMFVGALNSHSIAWSLDLSWELMLALRWTQVQTSTFQEELRSIKYCSLYLILFLS